MKILHVFAFCMYTWFRRFWHPAQLTLSISFPNRERERAEDWIQAKCEQCRILDWRNSLLKDPVRISFFLNIEKLPLFQNPSTYKIHIFAVALLMPLLLSWILIYLFLLSLSLFLCFGSFDLCELVLHFIAAVLFQRRGEKVQFLYFRLVSSVLRNFCFIFMLLLLCFLSDFFGIEFWPFTHSLQFSFSLFIYWTKFLCNIILIYSFYLC